MAIIIAIILLLLLNNNVNKIFEICIKSKKKKERNTSQKLTNSKYAFCMQIKIT